MVTTVACVEGEVSGGAPHLKILGDLPLEFLFGASPLSITQPAKVLSPPLCASPILWVL